MKLWIYWENPPGVRTPEYIKLCRRSIFKNNTTFEPTLVTPATLFDYVSPKVDISGIIRRGNRGKHHDIAVKTSYLRMLLLRDHGGIWLDSDAILVRDLGNVLQGNEFAVMRKQSHGDNHCSNGFMASVPHGKVVTECVDLIEERLSHGLEVKWGELGIRLLTRVANRHTCTFIPESRLHPIPHQENGRFFKPGRLDLTNVDIVMLFNNIFPSWFKQMTADELLNGDMLISSIFRSVL